MTFDVFKSKLYAKVRSYFNEVHAEAIEWVDTLEEKDFEGIDFTDELIEEQLNIIVNES